MSWFRVDDQSAFHPKVVRAGNAAFGAWVRFGAYCNAQLTDGFVPDQVARLIASQREIDAMIAAGMLHSGEGGFQIHDYHDFQPTSADVRQRRAIVSAKRATAGRAGGMASGESRRSKSPATDEANSKQIASQTEANVEAKTKPRPDPYPDPGKDTQTSARTRVGPIQDGEEQMALLAAWNGAKLPGNPPMWQLAAELRNLPSDQRMTPDQVMGYFKRLIARWTADGLTARVTVENLIKNLSILVQMHRGEYVESKKPSPTMAAAVKSNAPPAPFIHGDGSTCYSDCDRDGCDSGRVHRLRA